MRRLFERSSHERSAVYPGHQALTQPDEPAVYKQQLEDKYLAAAR